MKNSQFEAKTFGVGELIMQRKLFVVPPHQRSYAWGKEAVEEFFEDIDAARSNGAADYFIGLIVIQGSTEGEWILLDGQQRLSTVSLIYSAIRYWFHAAGFVDDAKQINHDYLGVRRLGGDYSSRMVMNQENRSAFEEAATSFPSDKELASAAQQAPKKSSNRLLLDAAVAARQWINRVAGERTSSNQEGAKELYALARFLDAKLKVVAVEVSSEVDAYVLFEALNDRGVALSALDLIKNYIFSKFPAGQYPWQFLMEKLGDSDPEDFLKVFWTSRYGNNQKSQIFRGVKEKYSDELSVQLLIQEMHTDAVLLAAISEDDHPYWEGAARGIRDELQLLRLLDSKQARPVLISILRDIASADVAFGMIGSLAAALFRFQVVGKGRTGVVEKVVGRLCTGLRNGLVSRVDEFAKLLDELFISDAEFIGQFMSYSDQRFSRLAYVLAEDAAYRGAAVANLCDGTMASESRASVVRNLVEGSRLQRLYSPSASGMPGGVQAEYAGLAGNFYLEPSGASPDLACLLNVPTKQGDPLTDVLMRTEELARRATAVWSPAFWMR
jgi:hypothetical protein